ncbi:RDD family protein [Acinetobacter rudis]|uniref:RDD family protein n=1 Tax=Acinetobacter rudis TaxID=632955 RepID=A0AAW8J6Q3_9GAMM|nr:RDD family protein [Acinetobacter rudis]MDQ8935420.1 RDD family protein [Acinetobacter rudis]MDQ9017683.1 RDD family protein [Acinetobacter rudis]
MQIYLARNNQQAGPYTVEQVNQMLSSQQVLLTDLAWYQGMTEWKALGELTQGKLYFEPEFKTAPLATETVTTQNTATQARPSNISKTTFQLASVNQRLIAKLIDLLFWLPLVGIQIYIVAQDNYEKVLMALEKMRASSLSLDYQAMESAQADFAALLPVSLDTIQIISFCTLLMFIVQAVFITKYGQSIGKKIMKIKIVDAQSNDKVGFLRVFAIRTFLFVLIISALPLFILFDLVFALNEKRQTLHDKLAKTKVIKL